MASLEEKPAKAGTALRRASREAAEAKEPRILKVARRLGDRIPAHERLAVPADFSDQLDHYIYGTPKR